MTVSSFQHLAPRSPSPWAPRRLPPAPPPWNGPIPRTNTNGQRVTDLAGICHIYYGTSESALNNEITVSSTSETSYTISGLAAGTWYFGATAYTTTGMQSALSAIGIKTIPSEVLGEDSLRPP